MLKYPQKLHPYVYCRNNPIIFIDPLGLSSDKDNTIIRGKGDCECPPGKKQVTHWGVYIACLTKAQNLERFQVEFYSCLGCVVLPGWWKLPACVGCVVIAPVIIIECLEEATWCE